MIRSEHRAGQARILALMPVLLTAVPPVRAAELSAGRWLVDLGRDYGLAPRSRPTSADATIILSFMQAAVRVEPTLGEAHYWQVDLLPALGKPDLALQALEKYVTCVPDDDSAHLMLIANRLDELQTSEQRDNFCVEYLRREGLAPAVVSDLRRRVAEFQYNRGQTALARKNVEAALAAFSLNVAARRLGYELSDNTRSPADRVRVGLEMISANPSQSTLIWDLAGLLDGLSLHEEAQRWYAYAAEVFSYANPGSEPPVDFLLDWARSRLDGGDAKAAMDTCDKAVARDTASEEARMAMIEIANASGRPEVALSHQQALKRHYDDITPKVQKTNDAAQAARMAWFYSWYAPEKLHASAYARIAAGGTMDAFARRAVGFADLINERYEEAIRWLKPLAGTDQIAAVGLAKALSLAGRRDEAVRVLQSAATLRFSGIGFKQIEAQLRQTGAEVPIPPKRDDVNEVLGRFDRRVLDFFRQPNKYLSLEMVFSQGEVEPGRPWELAFRLKNIGPFPITLGQELMVTPKVMLSAVSVGDKDRFFHHYLRFGMNRRQALLPNEFIEVATTVDVGPFRSAMFVTPQVTHEVTFSLLLDPVQTPQGDWTHRLGGFSVQPIRVTRRAVDAGASKVAVLLTAAREGDESERAYAVNLLAALLAEHDRLRSGVLSYRAEKVDETAIVQLLIDRLRDKSALVRARALEVLRFVRPRNELITAMAPRLSDSDWLVRFLAMYSLAELQGRVFAKVLERSAQSDPDPLLRTFAKSYLQVWSGPQTQPAVATKPAS